MADQTVLHSRELRVPEDLPAEFLERMKRLLTKEEYQAFLSSYGRKRLFSLRINPLKCSAGRSCPAGRFPDFCPVPWEPDGFYYPEELHPGRLPWHEAGMYYIQEASAMVPAMLCGVQPGERVLDLCAAPGGKSTKLAADLRGEGLLVANEIHPERAKVLSGNLERMGVRNALVTNASPQELAVRFPLFFDRIVVDAPCSGEGMFRKEEEALRHWSVENVKMCADRQLEILEEAASMLRAGGRLVYSTCTFAPEENEGTIARFLTLHPEFSIVAVPEMKGAAPEIWGFAPGRPDWGPAMDPSGSPEVLSSLRGTVRLWPHRLEGEGHFAAVLQKEGGPVPTGRPGTGSEFIGGAAACSSGQEMPKTGKRAGKAKKKRTGKKEEHLNRKDAEKTGLWDQFRAETLTEHFLFPGGKGTGYGVGPERTEHLFWFGDTLYALPVPAESLPLAGLRILRAGLQLGTVTRGRFMPSHSLGMALHGEEAQRTVDLPGRSEEAFAWLRGEALPLPQDAEGWKGWVLVTMDGCAAGWGKAAGSMLKNHYPKGLRKGSGYRADPPETRGACSGTKTDTGQI